MRICEVYSHMNGLEYIKVHLPHIWDEIQSIIKKINANACRTKVSKEKTKLGRMLISPVDLNQAFKTELEHHGWKESRASYYVTANPKLIRDTLPLEPVDQKRIIEAAGQVAMSSYNQTDFVKERVAIEVQFGKYSFVAYDLFVKHMAFYVSDKIDVGIEILPMKELQQEMSSGVPYYEGELYNVIRQGRGVPAVPLVIIGIAP